MLESVLVDKKKQKQVGAIDALATGFDIVRRRPWLPAIPVMLHILLWLGPRVSVAPLATRLAEYIMATQSANASMAPLAQAQATLITQWGGGFNLLSLLSGSLMGMASFVAMLIGGRIGTPTLFAGQVAGKGLAAPVVIADPWQALGLCALLIAVGLLLSALFLGMVAQAVRGEPFSLARLGGRAGRSWVRLLMLTLLAPLALVVFGAPVVLLVAFLALFSLEGAFFLVSVGTWFAMMVGVWATIYLYFIIDAIVLDDVPVLQGIWRSFNVVRRGFGATAILILLVALLGAGLSVVWQQVSGSAIGAIIAILGNGFVAAGLVAASLFFYQHRRLEWQRVIDELRARLQQASDSKPAGDVNA